jgi:hypothetical protein
LSLIKNFFIRHATIDSVFLYSNFLTIHNAVLRTISSIYKFTDISSTIPKCLLGFDSREKREIANILRNRGGNAISRNRNIGVDEVTEITDIPFSKGCGLNIVELLAQYLNEIELEDFDDKPIRLEHNGERCYGRFVTADLYYAIFEEVQYIYGEDVIPICLQFSFDGTDISGGGGSAAKSSTPFNIRLLNVSDKIFSLKANTILAGFAPQITVSFYFYIEN